MESKENINPLNGVNSLQDLSESLKQFSDKLKSEGQSKLPFEQEEEQKLQWQNEEDYKKLKKKYKRFSNELKKCETGTQISDGMQKFWNDFRNAYTQYRNNLFNLENLLKDLAPLQDEVAKLNKSKDLLDKLQERLKEDYQKNFDDQKAIQEEEQEKRKELNQSFTQTIQDIQKQVDEQSQKRIHQSRENEILKEKLKEVQAQYAQRDLLFQAELKKKEIENQISQTQFQSEMLFIQQQASMLSECQKGLDQLKENNLKLDEKVAFYESKDKGYNDLISHTNNQFGFYKSTMDNLQKEIQTVEQTVNSLKKQIQKKDDENLVQTKGLVALLQESQKEDKSIEGLQKLLKSLTDQLTPVSN